MPCPICHSTFPANPRYPNYVCPTCADKATDAAGRKLEFYNTAAFGGFEAVYADTRETYPSNVCFIDGVQCWADEARFGGIVIEKMNP